MKAFKQNPNTESFKGILTDKEIVRKCFKDAGMKTRIIWQFGEPVEVEQPEPEVKKNYDEEVFDTSLPIVNATRVNHREKVLA